MTALRTAATGTAPDVVDALVESGIVAPEDRERALGVVAARLPGRSQPTGSAGNLVATLLGYVGGILVVAAGALLLSLRWNALTVPTRVLALAVAAALLAVVAVVLRRSDRGDGADDAGRRTLAGVLGVGAAGLSAFAAGTGLEHRWDMGSMAPASLSFLLFTALAVVFHLISPSVPGQLAVAFGAVVTIFLVTDWALADSIITAGLLVLAVGIGWLVLAELGAWRADVTARLVGGAITVIGAQTPLFHNGPSDSSHGLAYALLTLVGFGGFFTFVRRREWPYLAVGVIGLTLAATEAAVDYFDGSGAAIGLLVAGSVLLITSLIAMRLRRGTDAA